MNIASISLVWIGLVVSVASAADPVPVDRGQAIALEFGPHTTVITQPRTNDGLPDYVAALNQRLSAGVAKDENFWVLMWPALGNAERSGEDFLRQVEQQLGVTIARQPRLIDPSRVAGLKSDSPEVNRLHEQQTQAMSRPWSRQEFPVIAQWVDAHAAILDEVHAACQRPKSYAPLIAGEDRPAVVQILLPHVQSLRSVARLQAARAMLRLNAGDVEGSWRDLVDLQRLARHSERGFTLIEALVGYAIRGIALQPTGHWLASCGLPAEELERRRAVLAELTRVESLARSIDCERYMYLDTVVCLMSGAATPGSTMNLLGSDSSNAGLDDGTNATLQQLRSARDAVFQLLLLGSDANETLRYGNGIYDDLVAAMQPETHAERQVRLQAIDAVVARNSAFTQDSSALIKAYLFSSRQQLRELPGRALTGLLMPAITAVEKAQTRSETYRALLDAAFSVRIHFARTGEIPVSIAELPVIPETSLTDPFSAETLRLTADGRGVILYSVGINGRDDGGQTYGEGNDHDDLRIILPLAP